ncbi:MAG TPA: cobalamin-dependent protein [Thermoleophilia bacterium]|nr:cobalamin-dependent protein [Thermoleophilia bacterium]
MTPTPLAQSVGELQMDEAARLVQEKLDAGDAPLAVLEELQQGMSIVGDRFEAGEYYLSELIFAGELFKQASAPLQDAIAEAAGNAHGIIVLGTVKNDIHEFGKNIAGTVLSSNGIKVVDLGVDVDPQAWVDAVNETGATLVGMSALLTTVFDQMKEAVATIERAGLRDKVTILIGGGPMTEEAAQYVGADHYCETAQDGVVVAKNVLGVS